MISTLAERLKDAMKGPPKVTGKMLAEACGIKPPSVSAWLSGRTKTIEGSNLVAAAKLLKVRPEWLADGTGLRDVSTGNSYAVGGQVTVLHAKEAGVETYPLWPFKSVKPEQYQLLDEKECESIENTILLLIRARADQTKQDSPEIQSAAG